MKKDIGEEYIRKFIEEKELLKEYGWVLFEVLVEYFRYRNNHPSGDELDQARGAIRATAHQ